MSACSSASRPRATPATSTAALPGRSRNGGWCRTTTTLPSAMCIRSSRKLVKVDLGETAVLDPQPRQDPVRLGLDGEGAGMARQIGMEILRPADHQGSGRAQAGPVAEGQRRHDQGKPYDAAVLAKQADHDIVFTVLQDDMPVGGMTYRLSTDAKQGLAASAKTKADSKSAKAAKPQDRRRPFVTVKEDPVSVSSRPDESLPPRELHGASAVGVCG